MVTVDDIINNTRRSAPNVYKNRRSVRIYINSLRSWKNNDGVNILTYQGTARDYKKSTSRSNSVHQLEIDFYGRRKDAKVWVLCSCEYFFFHCAWVLSKKGASDLDTNSNMGVVENRAPEITNPGNYTRGCKHILAALDGIGIKGFYELARKNYKNKRLV